MMQQIARQGCCTSHCPFGRAMAASQLDKFVALGSVCYCSAHGSYLLHWWAFLVITDVAHKPSNHSMKPTARLEISSVWWRRHPAVAYLCLVRPNHAERPHVLSHRTAFAKL